jgi:hypothetical protein
MTEQEWLDALDPDQMLKFVQIKISGRKLRLFAVHCARLFFSGLLDARTVSILGLAERYSDGQVTTRELGQASTIAYWEGLIWLLRPNAAEVTLAWCHRSNLQRLDRAAQADALRHVFGNPFRSYPAPEHWPSPVIKLADAMYAGEDCSFALHDALLEAGHPELAEHFTKESLHPKGCWVVDLILGKS